MRHRWRTIIPWVPCALLLGAYLQPVAGCWTNRVLGPLGGVDAVMQAGILEWTGRHWWHPGTWVALPIFHPEPGALAFMDSLLGQALLVSWLRLGGYGTVAALYNAAVLASLLLAAGAFAILWRVSGGERRFAGWGCLALLGSPYTLSQLGHLNQLPPPPLLCALAALIVIADTQERQPARVRITGWLWGGAMVWQAAWGWYGTAYAAFASAAVLAWSVWRGGVRSLKSWTKWLAGPALLATLGILVLAVPYLQASSRHSDYYRSKSEIRYYSADLKHFLNPGPLRLQDAVLRGWPSVDTTVAGRNSRIVLHPGWVALLLALLGWWGRRRLGDGQAASGALMLALGLLGLILAFGDSVGWPGRAGRLPLPLGIFQDLLPPLRALRTVWRFSFLFTLAVAWWAAAGAQVLWSWPGRERLGRGVATGLLVLLLVESLPVGIPPVAITETRDGGARDLLAKLPAGAVLTLPAPPDEYAEDLTEARWLHRSLQHGHPVTGGVSGWVPPLSRRLRAQLAACEDGALNWQQIWQELEGRGVRYVEVAEAADPARGEFWHRMLAQHGWHGRFSLPGYTLFLQDRDTEAAAIAQPSNGRP